MVIHLLHEDNAATSSKEDTYSSYIVSFHCALTAGSVTACGPTLTCPCSMKVVACLSVWDILSLTITTGNRRLCAGTKIETLDRVVRTLWNGVGSTIERERRQIPVSHTVGAFPSFTRTHFCLTVATQSGEPSIKIKRDLFTDSNV